MSVTGMGCKMEQPEQSWNKVGGSIVKLCGIIKNILNKNCGI